MSKVTPIKIPYKTRKNLQKRLFEKMSKLNTSREIEKFMADLLTESELVMVTRRLQVAKMLLQDALYEEIKHELGVGFSTIIAVRKKIESGGGGYINFIQELK